MRKEESKRGEQKRRTTKKRGVKEEKGVKANNFLGLKFPKKEEVKDKLETPSKLEPTGSAASLPSGERSPSQ
jgi:hypothetical protein